VKNKFYISIPENSFLLFFKLSTSRHTLSHSSSQFFRLPPPHGLHKKRFRFLCKHLFDTLHTAHLPECISHNAAFLVTFDFRTYFHYRRFLTPIRHHREYAYSSISISKPASFTLVKSTHIAGRMETSSVYAHCPSIIMSPNLPTHAAFSELSPGLRSHQS